MFSCSQTVVSGLMNTAILIKNQLTCTCIPQSITNYWLQSGLQCPRLIHQGQWFQNTRVCISSREWATQQLDLLYHDYFTVGVLIVCLARLSLFGASNVLRPLHEAPVPTLGTSKCCSCSTRMHCQFSITFKLHNHYNWQ